MIWVRISRLIVVLCLSVGLSATLNRAEAQQNDVPRVLLLNSYHPGYIWSDQEFRGIQDSLPDNIELVVEYMDTKRYQSAAYFDLLFQTLQYKYSAVGMTFDLVIAIDDNAFNFVLQHGEELFGNTPVVFGGINRFDESVMEGHTNITGVIEPVEYEGTLQLAIQLHPEIDQLLVVTDQTPTSRSTRAQLETLIREGRIPVEMVFLDPGTGLMLPELLELLENAPPTSVVFFSDFFQDREGNFLRHEEIVPLISAHSAVPVYVHNASHLGYGVVGGNVNSGYYHGLAVGSLARRVLQGEPPAEIPIQIGPTKYMFDYQQLERWQIPLAALPAGSIVVNRPNSLYDQYKEIIWGAIIFVVAQASIIAYLLMNVYRRRQAQKTLLESEQRYRHLIELSPIPIVVHSDGKLIFLNPAAMQVFGASREEELIGKSLRSFVHPDYREDLTKHIDEAYQSQQDTPILEEKIIRKDGQLIDVEVRGRAIRYAGKPAIQVVFQDITDRKEAERQKLDLAVERERVNILRQFIADVSHDFKTPLATLRTSLHLLEKKIPPSNDYQRHIDNLENQTDHLAKLVDDMLRLSRLDVVTDLEFHELDLNALVNDIVDKQLDSATHKRQRLEFKPDAALPAIQANKEQIDRAITNIIENALHYTPDGGTISVYTRQDADYVVIEVHDTGMGIAQEDLPHVFDRFYRGDRARNSSQGGTGLGLAIAKKVVEMHTGDIAAISTPGHGSQFRICLPIVPLPQSSA